MESQGSSTGKLVKTPKTMESQGAWVLSVSHTNAKAIDTVPPPDLPSLLGDPQFCFFKLEAALGSPGKSPLQRTTPTSGTA